MVIDIILFPVTFSLYFISEESLRKQMNTDTDKILLSCDTVLNLGSLSRRYCVKAVNSWGRVPFGPYVEKHEGKCGSRQYNKMKHY